MAHRRRLVLAVACSVLCLACAAAWARSYSAQDLILYERPRPPSGHWQVAVRSESGVFAVEAESKPAGDAETTMDGTVAAADGVATGWLHLSFPAGTGNYADASEQWHGIRIGFTRGVLMLAGDRWSPSDDYDGRDHRTMEDAVWCPYWMLWLPLTGAAAVTARRAWRRRPRPGRCPQCDYDLRGSPGRCPECGTSAA